MSNPMIRILTALAFTVPALPAVAQAVYSGEPYGGAYGHGYGRAFVSGSYIGAPFTRFPRPSEIVPAPWSYGTYGIPTVSGLPSAPVSYPTLTVIDAAGSRASSRRGDASAAGDRPAGVRVIEVKVPRR